MKTDHSPQRDYVFRYLSDIQTPVAESAAIHYGMLKDMKIKLSAEEIDHLFSLKSEIAIENWCRKIIKERL